MRFLRSLLILAGVATIALSQDRALGFDRNGFSPTVRAQDDFYQYVNGPWLAAHPIPSDRTSIGTFVVLGEKSEEVLHEILDQAMADKKAPAGSVRRKLADFYSSFMDSVAIEKAGLVPIKPLLDRVAALKDKSELPALYGALARAGEIGRAHV